MMTISNPSRERFNSLAHLVDRDLVSDLIKRLRDAGSRPVSYAHQMFTDDKEMAKRICYFVYEEPEKTGSEVRFAPFGILDIEGKGCAGCESRDLSEFRLVVLPSQLPTLGLPMLGWDQQVVKCFKFNTADSDEQWAKQQQRYRTKFQAGLVSRDAFDAGEAYSAVIYRVDDN
jgi:hypothetical protein